MIYRTLGHTQEKVSAIGVGGWHLGINRVDEQLAIRIGRTAIDSVLIFGQLLGLQRSSSGDG